MRYTSAHAQKWKWMNCRMRRGHIWIPRTLPRRQYQNLRVPVTAETVISFTDFLELFFPHFS